MKWFFVLLLLWNCETRHDPNKKNLLIAYLAINYQAENCRTYSGEANPVFTGSYYANYITDQTQYNKIILGDSTMDIACKWTNYISTGTACFPVSGNTLCDMQEQLYALNSKNPSFVMVSTSGGNDLLRKISNENIIKSGKSLIDKVTEKFPNAIKLIILVHPTRVDYANTNRKITNAEIKSYAESKGWKVENPDSVFTIESDGKASQNDLIDSIHPTQTTGFKIKNKIYSDFGLLY